jgi:thiol-activated cytolysin
MVSSLSFISSCTTDEFDSKDLESSNKYANTLAERELKWDESYHPNVCTRSVSKNESYEFVPVGLKNIYPGMILKGDELNNGKIVPISEKADPLGLVFTVPSFHVSELQQPSYINYMKEFKKALNDDDFSGQQIEEFEYDLKQFSNYSEMKLAFGANVDICSILKIDGSYDSKKIKHKTGLFARVCQKNFESVIDYPEDGNIFKDNSKLSKYPNAVYVNSITYGRMAIISIESDSSYSAVKSAFKIALNIKKVDGKISMDQNAMKLLREADISIWIRGGNGSDVVKTINGFDEFANYIINGGTFTKEIPGQPIFCTVNKAEDNSAFALQFVTNN